MCQAALAWRHEMVQLGVRPADLSRWPQIYLPTSQNYAHGAYTGVFSIDDRNPVRVHATKYRSSLGQNSLPGFWNTVCRNSPQSRFWGFKFALNPFNPSFKVRYIDNSVDICRAQLDIASLVQGLGTQPVHARATARPATWLQ